MALLRLRVSAEMADQLFPDLPFVLRREYDESVSFAFDLADGSGYTTPPINSIGTLQAIMFQPDQDVTVRLAAQSDAGTPVGKGGLFVAILSSTGIDNTGFDAVTIDNNSGSTATIRGVACGT